MNYLKKMCILRQIKQGFSSDGKTLSGLIKAEQYGKNLAVEVSVINFAPLVSGEYYCLLSDGKGKSEMLSLRGKSFFNLITDMDISEGFCGILCHIKTDVVPIAYGVNGNGNYDWKSILNSTLPPVFPKNTADERANTVGTESAQSIAVADGDSRKEEKKPSYDDESLATKNYYEEKENEREQSTEFKQNASSENSSEKQIEEERSNQTENGNVEGVLHPFKSDSDGYYLHIKEEVDELFRSYPRDKTLNGAFSCSDWVRIKGTAKDPQYLVGILYYDGRAKYICYALATEDEKNPPEEIANCCTFLPYSVFEEKKGFFVIFQSAATGECVKPEKV